MQDRNLGVMIDCSRNAVMKPEKVKEFVRLIAKMGYRSLQLYTEDTYEIGGEPYFGHMRGRYTEEELRELDAYCASQGVELIPCIQVLAHLERIHRWEPYPPHMDNNQILLVGDPYTYELIDRMFDTLERCFTSRTVNVGMDEAHALGLGQYLTKHGYRDRSAIMAEHLAKVKEIADRHGFSLMIWGDMFIRLNNGGEYYVDEPKLTPETVDGVPEGVELIYWDYYFKDPAHYDAYFDIYGRFRNPVSFAGGIWTWTGFAPSLSHSLDVAETAMRSAQGRDLKRILFTMWGDGGKECSFFATLPALFAAAEFARGNFDRAAIAAKFESLFGYRFADFMALELPNIVADEPSNNNNPCRYLLYNDPFLGLYDSVVTEGLADRYRAAAQTLAPLAGRGEYGYLFDLQKKLLDVLSVKCDMGIRLRRAYTAGDKDALRRIADEFPVLREGLRQVYEAHRTVWDTENKPFGFEVQDARIGGLLLRWEHCERRLREYLNGEADRIDELEQTPLPVMELQPGKEIVFVNHGEMITAGGY